MSNGNRVNKKTEREKISPTVWPRIIIFTEGHNHPFPIES